MKNEMYEGIEAVIYELIDEYNNKPEYYESDGWVNTGAIMALEELLRRLNE